MFEFTPDTRALLVRGTGWGHGHPGKCYPLDERRVTTIGSSPHHDIIIDPRWRPPRTWQVVRESGRWLYRPETVQRADDEPLDPDEGPTWLASGDTLAVGPVDGYTFFTLLESDADPEPAYRDLVRSQGLFLDPLTGTFHRSYLRHAIAEHGADICRRDGSLWALLVDIDMFKRLNDYHGFPVGDAVLGRVAAVACRCVYGHALAGHRLSAARPLEADRFCGRQGGEEFLILLRDVTGGRAAELAETIRSEVMASPCVIDGSDVPATVSIGVVEWQVTWTGRELLQRVENAMYAAKQGGRDQVFASGA